MMTEVLWADYSFGRPDLAEFTGVMRYLNISPTGSKGLSLTEIADLQSKGKTIGLVWETSADAAKGGAATAADHVKRANAEADKMGAPQTAVIFYAVDFDATVAQVQDYVLALGKTAGRPVGVYGSYTITTWARTAGIKWTWQTAAWSKSKIDPDANLYQRDFLDGYDRNVEKNPFPAWGRTVTVPTPTPTPAPTTPPKETTVASCKRTTWRGVIVCAHSVPKYNAWAASTGSILLTPLAGCGSYQTSTVASAGTHAGGGAIDIDLRKVAADKRKWVADKGRTSGLQVAWHRNYVAGLWTWHCHALDPACPNLAKGAVSQCYEVFAGGDGLVGSRADGNTRANITQLQALFKTRLIAVVAQITDDAKVRLLQQSVRQIVTGVWDIQTDIDLRNTRAEAQGKFTGAYFKKWNLVQRKRMQRTWGVAQDGIWGAKTKAGAQATTKAIQAALGVTQDTIWGAGTDAAYAKLKTVKYRPFDYTKPTGAFPAPGAAGTLYGPSTSSRPLWYSGKVAGKLSKNSIQWQIKRIQRAVGAPATGLYDTTTVAKVKAWQKARKLTVDGVTGKQTWDSMVKANHA